MLSIFFACLVYAKMLITSCRLRAVIVEIEENEDILVGEIETLVKEKSDFQQRSDDLSSKCDSLFAELDESTRASSDLLQEKTALQGKLEAERLSHSQNQE